MKQTLASRSLTATIAGLAALVALPHLASAKPRLQVQPAKPKAGDAVLVTVRGVKEAPSGTIAGTKLRFVEVKGGWQAVHPTPLEDAPESLEVSIADTDLSSTVELKPRDPAEDVIEVDEKYAEPPADKRAQISDDNKKVLDAIAGDGAPQYTGRFRKPGGGKITSRFGAWRKFNGDYRSQHLGTDYWARKGAPVKAVQAGTVTLTADTFLMGKVVVVNHGGGLGSAYFHLDEFKVEKGGEVKKGAVIGTAGDGGRTTGPHIHLAIAVHGELVDPESFLKLPLRTPAANAVAEKEKKEKEKKKKNDN